MGKNNLLSAHVYCTQKTVCTVDVLRFQEPKQNSTLKKINIKNIRYNVHLKAQRRVRRVTALEGVEKIRLSLIKASLVVWMDLDERPAGFGCIQVNALLASYFIVIKV